MNKLVLVDVTLRDNSIKPLRCYAIIDEGSDSTFIDPKVAHHFNINGPLFDYSLKTLHGSQLVANGILIRDLQVKGVNEKKKHSLRNATTNPFLPDCRDEIASPEAARSHPQTKPFAKNFAPVDSNCEILVLVGRNSGSCMRTRCYGNAPPFVHHTALGWALVGECCTTHSSSSPLSPVALKTNLSEHFSAIPSFPFKREVYDDLAIDIYSERRDDELLGSSREDIKFVDNVKSGIRLDNK